MSDEKFDRDTLANYLFTWKAWLIKHGEKWRDDDEKALQDIRYLIIKHGEKK